MLGLRKALLRQSSFLQFLRINKHLMNLINTSSKAIRAQRSCSNKVRNRLAFYYKKDSLQLTQFDTLTQRLESFIPEIRKCFQKTFTESDKSLIFQKHAWVSHDDNYYIVIWKPITKLILYFLTELFSAWLFYVSKQTTNEKILLLDTVYTPECPWSQNYCKYK